jgi:hypothetical protein
MKLRTCVTPQGKFKYAVHKPSYEVDNLRQREHLLSLGTLPGGEKVLNEANFPQAEVKVAKASTVYEIPNAFAFRGSTFIDSSWAASKAADPAAIKIIAAREVSMTNTLQSWAQENKIDPQAAKKLFQHLPKQVLLALATTSTDSEDLVSLAHLSCKFSYRNADELPAGLAYKEDEQGCLQPVIQDHDLFEAVANNPFLPDAYKEVMVLRPGAQGGSEIVGDYLDETSGTHIYEYLRRNSYIPWGHYAANMAHDAVRYRIRDLTLADMQGLRHLYYQRIMVRLAREVGVDIPERNLSEAELEDKRKQILEAVQKGKSLKFTSSLWGWNFGFDFAPTRYRLHASHQQIHQQNAMIPDRAKRVQDGNMTEEELDCFACGDMLAEVVSAYRAETGQDFFEDLIGCIRSNRRTDGQDGEQSLIVYEDEQVLLFVPKAQVSQWELQLMPLHSAGNVLEADSACRTSLDKAMLLALRILEEMGARMVTCIEYAKRFTHKAGSQRLLYSFLPRLPWSPGSFSEAQNRFICGHYPEDFAAACRRKLQEVENEVL